MWTLRTGLLMTLATLAMTEGLLRLVDPMGTYRYFADLAALSVLARSSDDGIRYAPGEHCFRMYCVEINEQGFRAVLSAEFRVLRKCKIVFAGDSVTFGMGSSLSFVDVLARGLDAHVVNAGFPAYSAANVLAELDTIPADGYVWLIVQNDDEPLYQWKQTGGNVPSATTLYLDWLTGTSYLQPVNAERFTRYADAILNREDVLAFAFDDNRFIGLIRQRYPQVVIIPEYSGHVSRYDVHPDPQGAVEIAAMMHDTVLDFVGERCVG